MPAKTITLTYLKAFLFFALFSFTVSCADHTGPDVSAIKVSAPIERFDEYFFTKFDTTQISSSLAKLEANYPYFANDFITNILGLPLPGQSADSTPRITEEQLKIFFRLTKPLYDSISSRFKETSAIRKGIEEGFRHVKYYHPQYQLPKLVMYLGPFNAPGVAITNEALAIGLQLFAGSNFSFYHTEAGLQMFPAYISRTFEPQYIPVNCMKAIVGDLYQGQQAGKSLIEQMIQKGKEWYMLDKLLPDVADTLKTGFTASQLEFCQSNEGMIWNAIIQSVDLYTTDPSLIQNYIGESPTTQGMPQASPGNIGQWIGYQIVLQYARRNPKSEPDEIMKTAAAKIFTESKYKPH